MVLTTLVAWVMGLWSLMTSSPLGRLPWTVPRYVLVFPVMLVLIILAIRRVKAVRLRVVVAGLAGCSAGALAGLSALAVVHAMPNPYQENFFSSLSSATGMVGFVLNGTGATALWGWSWLQGIVSAVLAVLIERLESHFVKDGEPVT